MALVAAGLTNLDLSKVQIGLPSIDRSLGANPIQLQFIVAGYALAYGLALVPAGRLGDVRSRRRLFLIGLVTFTAASVLCALAPTIEVLVVSRIVQGLAAGVQMPQVIGLAQTLFPGPERARALGTLAVVMAGSASIAPVLGGFLIALGGEPHGWRLTFWMNVPLGAGAIILAWRVLLRPERATGRLPALDGVGLALLGITTLGVMAPFLLASSARHGEAAHWFLLVPAIVAGTAFVLWERRYARSPGRLPLIDLRLLRMSTFRNGIVVTGAYYAAVPSVILAMVLYVQDTIGASALDAGLMIVPYTITAALSAWFGARLATRWGGGIVVGGVLVALGGVLLVVLATGLPAEQQVVGIGLALGSAGAGGGTVMSINQLILLDDVDPAHGGVAGSIAQLTQRVGNSIGLASISGVYFAVASQEVAGHPGASMAAAGLAGAVFLVIAFIFAVLNRRARPSSRPGVPRRSPDR